MNNLEEKKKVYIEFFSLLNCGKRKIYLNFGKKGFSGAIFCDSERFSIKDNIPTLLTLDIKDRYSKIRAAYESINPFKWLSKRSDWIKHMRTIHFMVLNRVAKTILRKKQKNIRVLALGSGWGWEIWILRKLLKDTNNLFIGLDLARSPLIIANKIKEKLGASNTLFVVGNCEYLPFKSNTFDIVTAIFGALDHVSNYEKAFLEIARILKRDGLFAFTVLNKFSIEWILRVLFNYKLLIKTIKRGRGKFVRITIPTEKGRAYRILTHFYNRWELLKLLKVSGFRLVYVTSIFSILPANFKKKKFSPMEKFLSFLEKNIGSKPIFRWLGRYIAGIAIKK